MERKDILVIDDNRCIISAISRLFKGMVAGVKSVSEAEELVSVLDPRVIVADVQLEGENGITEIPRIKTFAPMAKIIVYTGNVNVFDSKRARDLGAYAYLGKESVCHIRRAISLALFAASAANSLSLA